MKIKGVPYPFDEKIQKDMKVNNISKMAVRKRVEIGWTLYEAVNTPIGMDRETFKQLFKPKKRVKTINKRLKDKKPYLFDGTPQKHSRSKYVSNDMDHRSIARLKTDLYGNVQLI